MNAHMITIRNKIWRLDKKKPQQKKDKRNIKNEIKEKDIHKLIQ